MKRESVIVFFLLISMVMSAQQAGTVKKNCPDNINNAVKNYESGLYADCIRILEATLDSCDLSRREKELVLETLAKSYVETGETGKAETTVNILLRNYPHYELEESENPESFNRMVKKYRIHPQLIAGAKNTGDFVRHQTIAVYKVLDNLDYSETIDDQGYFFTYYIFLEYEFIKDLSISVDFMFFWSIYNRYITEQPSFYLNYWEKDRFAEFPVYLKKYFPLGKNFLAYVSAGFGLFITHETEGNVTLSYTRDDFATTGKDQDFTGEMYGINTLEMKNKYTGQWNAGAGIGYTLKNLRFFGDIRYLGETSSFTAPEKSDLNPVLKYDYFYIDQAMKINQFEIGVTISYTLFNSVKRIHK